MFIEWGDAIEALLPGDHLAGRADLGEDGDQDRRIVVTGSRAPVGWALGEAGARARPRGPEGADGPMLVLAIETSTPQTTVALGTERGLLGSVLLPGRPGRTTS